MFVQPFIGCDYNSAKIKYLLLGESNYSPKGILETDHLIKMTSRYADPEDKFTYLFWTNIMQTIKQKSKRLMTPPEIQSFWENVVLHDYVCDRHERGIREIIPQEVWENSREPFLQILKRVTPDRIVFFSKRAADDVTKISELTLGDYVIQKIGQRTYVTTFKLNSIPTIALPHPSWYYNYKKFKDYFL